MDKYDMKKEISNGDALQPEEYNILQNRANMCLEISKYILPKATNDIIEDQSYELMFLGDERLINLASRLNIDLASRLKITANNFVDDHLAEKFAVLQTESVEGVVRLLYIVTKGMTEDAVKTGANRKTRLTAIALLSALKLIISDHPGLSKDYIKEILEDAEKNLEKTRP